MARQMKDKFVNYWNEYSVMCKFGAILNSSVELKFLNFCYSQLELDSHAVEYKINVTKQKL